MTTLAERKNHGALQEAAAGMKNKSMKTLMEESSLHVEFEGIHLDATRQMLDASAVQKLEDLATECEVNKQILSMFRGDHINKTENRSVLHVCLRSHPSEAYVCCDGSKDCCKDKTGDQCDKECCPYENGNRRCTRSGQDCCVNYAQEVHQVLDKIRQLSEAVRSGQKKGLTGKPLTDVVCIGIGGSYLGVEFVFEALRVEPIAAKEAQGRRLRFLANVDPIDVARALDGLDLEATLVIVISKTFTTAETIMNAKTVKDVLLKHYAGKGSPEEIVSHHVFAVSTNLDATTKFGISSSNVVGFWDWVGGRFSVTSAVGVLPLAIHYGFGVVRNFLDGARSIDMDLKKAAEANAKLASTIPGLMALVSLWNSTYMGYGNVAVLPYCQALLRFPAHIQQLTMESNGKLVSIDGKPLSYQTGEIYFGEPGTNGQHSFYQLLHQGRIVPSEFVGFTKSQSDRSVDGESNHDELMSNFFAQPDALALGKSAAVLKKEGCPEKLIPHKTFPGNRPSMSLLFEGHLDAYRAGQLLAIYEHRVAIQGFFWHINSFDQWGVELGKVLAKNVRSYIRNPNPTNDFPAPTKKLLNVYLKTKSA